MHVPASLFHNPKLSLFLAHSLALPSLHNLVTKLALSTQPVIGPSLVARNVDNGGMAGLEEGSSNSALEQRLQAIEEGIASIKAALTQDCEASVKDPAQPQAVLERRKRDASPMIAEAGFPFAETGSSGAPNPASHFPQSLCLCLGCLCFQPRSQAM